MLFMAVADKGPEQVQEKTLDSKDFQEFRDVLVKRSTLCDSLGYLELQRAEIVRQLQNLQEAQLRFSQRIQKKMGIGDFQVDMDSGRIKVLKNLGPMPEDEA